MKKRKVKIKVYDVLRRAIEEGVAYGITRSFKYSEDPEREYMNEIIVQCVMNELCEYVDFEDEFTEKKK